MTAQINGSVLKAFKILDLFAEGRAELTAGDVATALSINTVTAHRFLHTLEQVGAVRATARGVFRLGYIFADLGDRVMRDGGMASAMQPALDALARDLNEACMATRFEKDMAVCIAKALPDKSLYIDIRIGSRLDAFCTAHGKLWLAYMTEDQRDGCLAHLTLAGKTANTITSKSALKQELAQIRQDGFAVNNAERERDVYALAVPVFTRDGRMISAISAFGAAPDLVERRRAKVLDALRLAATRASDTLYGGANLA